MSHEICRVAEDIDSNMISQVDLVIIFVKILARR
jgi:hypothetical protein